MKYRYLRPLTAMGLVTLLALALASGGSLAQEKPKAPEPGVPELFTLKGQFVRIAYNNEGYVSLGYRLANQSAGEEWMLLQLGATVRTGGEYTLKREHLSIETPDGKTIPLSSNQEYRKASLRALEKRASVVRDSINYFPPSATRACPIRFFAELGGRGPSLAYDQVSVNDQRACLGRIFFKIPGGIQYGQHWLNVQFEKSLVRAPFRILTKEEEKVFSKTWKDIKKEHEKAFGTT